MMNTDAIADITLRELIGQMVRGRKEKVGGTTAQFESFVVEKELPELVSRMSKHLTAKRVHRLEGRFLGLSNRKLARKTAGRGDGPTTGVQKPEGS